MSIELATVYTGCFECDYETEFNGTVDNYDVAHFNCTNCKQEFTIADWSIFFEGEN